MQVFKTALKTFFRHPLYLVVYVVLFSCIGLFMGLSVKEARTDEYLDRPSVAIIDRDGGALAHGLAAFVSNNAEVVEVEDTTRSLQDAVMQDQVAFIIIVPEGFSERFASSVANGTSIPQVQTVAGSQAANDTMMDNLVNSYLNIARLYTRSFPAASQATVVERTDAIMKENVDVTITQAGETAPPSQAFLRYLSFAGYTILLSISICSAFVLERFNSDELHKRIGASPQSPLSVSLQLASACFVIMLSCCSFVYVLGLVVFGGRLGVVDKSCIVIAYAALVCYACFGLALGFFIGQLTGNTLVLNVVPNLIGVTLSFLGGTWISLDLASEQMRRIARFTPTYYYNEVVRLAFDPIGKDIMGDVLTYLALILLFAVTTFVVGLAVSRLKDGRAGSWNGLLTKASSRSAA